MKMTYIEMRKEFKKKAGFWRVTMMVKGSNCIKYKEFLCYPADQEGKFVEYTSSFDELTRDEANKKYMDYKKRGFVVTKSA